MTSELLLAQIAAILENDGDDGGSRESGLRSELELLAARALLGRGELDQADAFLQLAASHATDGDRVSQVAEQFLVLATARSKRGDVTVGAESALQRAAELAPARATAALARHMQRQGKFDEAIALWREAVRLDPRDSGAYLALARVHEQRGDTEQALATYLESMDMQRTASHVLTVAQRLQALALRLPPAESQQSVRIALEGNATLDHLRSYLSVECFRSGLRPSLYQGGFDQYNQDILDPSSPLYEFAPDVLVCAIHASRLFPTIHDDPFGLTPAERRAEVERGLHRIQDLLDALTARSSALVLLHNMVAPQHPVLAALDLRDELGQAALFAEINLRLAEIVRHRYTTVYLVDEDRLQARCGKNRATDPRLWLSARIGWSETVLPELVREYMHFIEPLKSLSRKCIVLDLDNTLWGGVIGEDGLDGIQLGPDAPGNAFVAFQRELLRLWRRGVLLAIASKNNLDDVRPVFDRHPGMLLNLSHFAAHRINWQPKAQSIREIAAELNLGLDSLVFLDDNPVERAQVRSALPQVLTPELPAEPERYRDALLELHAFNSLAITQEDRRRNQLYAEQRERSALLEHAQSGGRTASLETFLADLQIEVSIDTMGEGHVARVVQLLGKTNQFNLTTRRHTDGQLRALLAQGAEVYVAHVRDRFGDNGLVGVVLLTPESESAWSIDSLLLSCRVMGRGVETGVLATVVAALRGRGAETLNGWYVPTPKNAPASDCYQRHGFTRAHQEPDGAELWMLDLNDADISVPRWLSVRVGRSLVSAGERPCQPALAGVPA